MEPGEKKGDYDDFAPRLGFAYDLRGDGRAVLRGGFGRNFDKVLLNVSTTSAGRFCSSSPPPPC